MRATLRTGGIVCWALLLLACGGGGEGPGWESARLHPVEEPDLDQVEAGVREQLEQSRSELMAILDAPGSTDELKLAALGRAGMLYQAHGIRGAAETCYLNAQILAPEDHRWPYLLGHVYRDQGRPEPAVESFERALEIEAEHLPSLVHLARLHFDEDRHDLARPLFERAYELDPSSAAVRIGLGKIALAEKNFEEAVASFESALRLAPEATEANYPLGLAYRGLGDEEKARELLASRGKAAAGVDDPLMSDIRELAGGWRIHQNRGTSFYEEGAYESALGEYRRAVEAAPGEPLVRTNLGSTLVRLGAFDEAREQFETAVRLDPTAAMAHFNLGTLSARFGDDRKAVEHYEAALEGNPDHLDSHFNLGNALRRLGRFEEAIPHYRRVVEDDPRNAQARLAEALSLVRLHRYEGALVRLDEAAEALPEDRVARLCLAHLLAAAPQDEVRDGHAAYALAEELMKEEATLEHAVALAMAAAEIGDFQLALAMQTNAIAAAHEAKREDLLVELRENYELYRTQRPCRRPWREDDPMLAPPPLSPPRASRNP